jgi:hypothetical protein
MAANSQGSQRVREFEACEVVGLAGGFILRFEYFIKGRGRSETRLPS